MWSFAIERGKGRRDSSILIGIGGTEEREVVLLVSIKSSFVKVWWNFSIT